MLGFLLACGSPPAGYGLASLSSRAQVAPVAADFLLQSRNGRDAQMFATYNAAPADDSIGLWDSSYGASVNPNQFRILASIGSDGLVDVVRPYNTTGAVTIPSGGYVVQSAGTYLPWLANLFTDNAVRVRSTIDCEVGTTAGVAVVVYHDIGSSGAAFEAQLLAIQAAGYTTITLDQLRQFLDGPNDCDPPLPEKPILLTFDDAYVSQFAYAPALLDSYDMVGTFFVITSYPSSVSWVATWTAIDTAHDTYPHAVELACHSHAAHVEVNGNPKYFTMNTTQMEADLQACRDTLYAHTGVDTHAVAWPFGAYDQPLVDAAAAVGFDLMFTTWQGISVPENDYAGEHVRRFSTSVGSSWATWQTLIDRWYVCPP